MELAQKAEMVDEARRLRGVGDPQAANLIMKALDRDEYFLGEEAEAVFEEVEAPAPKAKKAVWVDFAKKVSDIDEEIIDGATKADIIKMLEANGII